MLCLLWLAIFSRPTWSARAGQTFCALHYLLFVSFSSPNVAVAIQAGLVSLTVAVMQRLGLVATVGPIVKTCGSSLAEIGRSCCNRIQVAGIELLTLLRWRRQFSSAAAAQQDPLLYHFEMCGTRRNKQTCLFQSGAAPSADPQFHAAL